MSRALKERTETIRIGRHDWTVRTTPLALWVKVTATEQWVETDYHIIDMKDERAILIRETGDYVRFARCVADAVMQVASASRKRKGTAQ